MDSKKPHYRVSLSEQALNHEKLMRAIVKNLADTPMVLKGGTALSRLWLKSFFRRFRL
ncbi:hypothetical protein ID0467_09970 [Helicobacter pylori]